MKFLTFLLIAASLAAMDVPTDNQVHLLTPAIFTEFVNLNPETVVFIHQTKCEYCDTVKGLFRDLLAARQEKHPDLKVGVVEGESDETFKGQNDIEGFPQIRLYLNKGFFAFYEGDLNLEGLIQFVDYHLQVIAEPLFVDSDRQYVRYKNKQNSIMIAFQTITTEEKEFAMGLQRVVPDIPVYYMREGSKYGYMLFPEDSSKSQFKMKMKRNFDEGDKFLGTRTMFEPRHVLKLVWPYRKNKVELYAEKHLNNTLKQTANATFFFDSDYNSDAAEAFSKGVVSSGWKAGAYKSTLKEETSEKLTTIFGVTPDDFPAIRIVTNEKGKLLKYKYEGDMDAKKIEEFFNDFNEGKVTPYKKSQRPQDNTGKVVKRLNREELAAQVADHSTHLVLGFVGKAARETEVMFEEAAALLKNPSQFTFATVDLNRNDIDGVSRSKLPVVNILTKTQRKRPLAYDDEPNGAALAKLLNEAVDLSDEL